MNKKNQKRDKTCQYKSTIMSEQTYLKPAEACRIFGVSDTTLRNWANQGLIDSIKTQGGHRRYTICKETTDLLTLKSGMNRFSYPNITPIENHDNMAFYGLKIFDPENQIVSVLFKADAKDIDGTSFAKVGRVWLDPIFDTSDRVIISRCCPYANSFIEIIAASDCNIVIKRSIKPADETKGCEYTVSLSHGAIEFSGGSIVLHQNMRMKRDVYTDITRPMHLTMKDLKSLTEGDTLDVILLDDDFIPHNLYRDERKWEIVHSCIDPDDWELQDKQYGHSYTLDIDTDAGWTPLDECNDNDEITISDKCRIGLNAPLIKFENRFKMPRFVLY